MHFLLAHIQKLLLIIFLQRAEQVYPWKMPYTNGNSPGLTPMGPPMGHAEADRELTLSASPATAVGEQTLTLAN